MPIYEYRCTSCGATSEVIQKMNDKPLKKCAKCSGSLEKLISRTSFQLKGTGWYATDYGSKAKGGGGDQGDSSSSSEDSSSSSADSKGVGPSSSSGSSGNAKPPRKADKKADAKADNAKADKKTDATSS